MVKLKPVPERIRVLNGAYPEVQDKIDDFIIETKNYLEDKYGKNSCFEIKVKNMEQSDNHLTYLIYDDRCVAGIFERRTEFNDLEYIFFRDLRQLLNKRLKKMLNNFNNNP